MPLTIISEMNGRFTAVTVTGALNNSTAHALKIRLFDLIDYKRRRFILDLTEVDFQDFTGIAALVLIAVRLRDLKGTLRIVAASEISRTFLKTTGFSKYYPPYDTLEAAMAEPLPHT